MYSPLLVVVQGAPGVGKTTLLKRLKSSLTLPVLGKDDIKEMLFDTIHQSDREFSRLQGVASFEMLYSFAETFLGAGHDVMIEGAFHHEVARPNIQNLISRTNARFLEIYCHIDEDTRIMRVTERVTAGTRHPAHLDHGVMQPGSGEAYGQLMLGDVIDVDMTDQLSDETYAQIMQQIRRCLVQKEPKEKK